MSFYDENYVILECKECKNVWMIVSLKCSSDKLGYVLSCPFCGKSGSYCIDKVELKR